VPTNATWFSYVLNALAVSTEKTVANQRAISRTAMNEMSSMVKIAASTTKKIILAVINAS
jgi:hypothetical protein